MVCKEYLEEALFENARRRRTSLFSWTGIARPLASSARSVDRTSAGTDSPNHRCISSPRKLGVRLVRVHAHRVSSSGFLRATSRSHRAISDPCTVAHPNPDLSPRRAALVILSPFLSPFFVLFFLFFLFSFDRRCLVLVQHSLTGTATSFRGSLAFLAIFFFFPPSITRASIEVVRHARRRRDRCRLEENSKNRPAPPGRRLLQPDLASSRRKVIARKRFATCLSDARKRSTGV